MVYERSKSHGLYVYFKRGKVICKGLEATAEPRLQRKLRMIQGNRKDSRDVHRTMVRKQAKGKPKMTEASCHKAPFSSR